MISEQPEQTDQALTEHENLKTEADIKTCSLFSDSTTLRSLAGWILFN